MKIAAPNKRLKGALLNADNYLVLQIRDPQSQIRNWLKHLKHLKRLKHLKHLKHLKQTELPVRP
jgi:hypothetical protein